MATRINRPTKERITITRAIHDVLDALTLWESEKYTHEKQRHMRESIAEMYGLIMGVAIVDADQLQGSLHDNLSDWGELHSSSDTQLAEYAEREYERIRLESR